jgi:hypothetical protein
MFGVFFPSPSFSLRGFLGYVFFFPFTVDISLLLVVFFLLIFWSSVFWGVGGYPKK